MDVRTQTAQALQISVSHLSKPEQRREAEEFLDNFKTRPDFWIVLNDIISEPNRDAIHFQTLALIVLRNSVFHSWSNLPISNKFETRNHLMRFLDNNIDAFHSKPFRREFAVLLAGIAKKQYPQDWPEFIAEMIRIWENNSTDAKEIVINILEDIFLDCLDTDFNTTMSTTRKQDILAEFKPVMEGVLQTAFNFSMQCFGVYRSQSNETELSQRCLTLLHETYEMLLPLVYFAKAKAICTASHDFLKLMVESAAINGLQEISISFISALTSQKMPSELFAPFMETCVNMKPCMQFCDLTESLQFQRNFAVSMHEFVGHNIAELCSPAFMGTANNVNLFCRYLQYLLSMLQSQSYSAMLSIFQEYLRMFRDENFRNLPFTKDLVDVVAKECIVKSIRVRYERDAHGIPTNPIGNEAVQLEFDDYEDYREHYSLLRSVLKNLFALFGEFFPEQVTALLLGTFGSLMTTASTSQNQDYLDNYQQLTYESTPILQWNVFEAAITPVAAGIHATLETIQSPHGLNKLQTAAKACEVKYFEVIQALLAWNPTDPLLCSARISVLESLVPIAKQNNQLLLGILLAFFNYIAYSGDNESAVRKEMSDRSTSVVASATAAIVTVCQTSKAAITKPEFPFADMINKIDSLLRSPLATPVANLHLRESLIVLSLLVPHQDRAPLLRSGLGGLIEPWLTGCEASDNIALREIFASKDTLFQFFTAQNLNKSKVLTYTISNLKSILSCLKKFPAPVLPAEVYTAENPMSRDNLSTLTPLVEYFNQILDVVRGVYRCIQSLWSFPVRMELEKTNMGWLYVPSVNVVRKTAGLELTAPLPTDAGNDFAQLRKFLEDIKSTLYGILSQAAIHKVLYCSDFVDMKEFLFEMTNCTEFMEHGDFVVFLKVFAETYVQNSIAADLKNVCEVARVILLNGTYRLDYCFSGSIESNIHQGSSPEDIANASLLDRLYKDCNVPENVGYRLRKEELESYRKNTIDHTISHFSEFVSCLACLKGHLVVKSTAAAALPPPPPVAPVNAKHGKLKAGNNKPQQQQKHKHRQVVEEETHTKRNSPREEPTAEKQEEQVRDARRNSLRRAIVEYMPLFAAYLGAILTLLCQNNMTSFKKTLDVLSFIMESKYNDSNLAPFFGNSFKAVLTVILTDAEWSRGLEWTMLETLSDMYCRLVLGLHADSDDVGQQTTGPKGSKAVAKAPIMITDLPRRVLLEIPRLTEQDVQRLEKGLREKVSTRKQRDLFKDFVSNAVSVLHQDVSSGSMFKKTVEAPAPLPPRISRPKPKAAREVVDISNLFAE